MSQKKKFNAAAERPLEGVNIAFTGKLDAVKRKQASAIAYEVGANVHKNVSGKTDLVVAGTDAGKKLQEAANRKITIVDEDTFFDLVRKQRAANKGPKA
jgi:DNA ligase (NAD+)